MIDPIYVFVPDLRVRSSMSVRRAWISENVLGGMLSTSIIETFLVSISVTTNVPTFNQVILA